MMDDTIPSVYNSSSTNGTVSQVPTSSHGGVSTGVVVGVAIAAFALGFVAFSILGFILLRRREARGKGLDEKLQVQPFDTPRPDIVAATALGAFTPSGSDPNQNIMPRTRNDPFQVGNGMRKGTQPTLGRQPVFASHVS